jgi:hypothetical protein
MRRSPITGVALAGFNCWRQLHAKAIAAVWCHGDGLAVCGTAALPCVPAYHV